MTSPSVSVECFSFGSVEHHKDVAARRRPIIRRRPPCRCNSISSPTTSSIASFAFSFPCRPMPVTDEDSGSCDNQLQDSEPAELGKDTKLASVESPPKLQLMRVARFLKGIPQSPHFWPLRRFSEHARKNLIAGCDRTFEEIFDQIINLRVENFWVDVGKLWKGLGDLQGLGYNVVPLRRRMVELGDVMEELRKLELRVLGLRERAEGHRMEKSRLEGVIAILKVRAEREQRLVDRVLREADEIEEGLPTFDVKMRSLALKPF